MSQTVTKWPFFGLSWIANPSHLRRHSFLSFQIFNTGEVEHVTTFFSVPWKIWSHQISDIHGPCLFGTMTGWRFGTWLLFTISYMGCHPKPIDELHHFSRWLKPPTNQWMIHDLVGGLEMNLMTFHILGIIIPTDFHIFQRGRLNHQPELDQNWVSGMVLMGSCHGLDPVEATNGSSQWLEVSLAKM